MFGGVSQYSVDYGALGEAMGRAQSPVSIAELHGGLCGAMCAGGFDAGDRWLEECLDIPEVERVEFEDLRALLRQMKADSWAALSGSGFEFTPLLPDDQASLEHRVEAIASWCHGFLTGLALGGFASEHGELMEIVEDFTQISKAAPDTDGSEEDEEEAATALMELTEFVRVSAQLVFEHLARCSGASAPKVLH